MKDRDAERLLELEESAEGESLFRAPGEQLQMEQARDQAGASDAMPGRAELGDSNHPRRQRARFRRNELHRAMERLEGTVDLCIHQVLGLTDLASHYETLRRNSAPHLDGKD